ncbi:MAG: hypothetical protein AB7F35_01070 [Acetobacteraceae bacterium]
MDVLFDRDAFSARVKSAVDAAGSYRKAARQCRISPAALNKIALGVMTPSVESFFRLKAWMDGKVPEQ